MVKYYYAKRGSKAFNRIEFNARRLLSKNIKLSDKQIRNWSGENQYRISLEQIKRIRKEIIIFKRKNKVKEFFLVHGHFEIVNVRDTEKYKELKAEKRLTPVKWLNIRETFLTFKKAQNRYLDLIKRFTLAINMFGDDPDNEINGALHLSAVNYGNKYGIKNLSKWAPYE